MPIQISSSLPFMVEKKRTEMVKPSKHVHQQTLSLSTLDNDPYNKAIYKACYVFKAKNVVTDDDDQPQSLLRKALSDLLVYYYPLSGSLKRQGSNQKLQLSCARDGNGVPFTVATTNLELSSLKNLENIDSDTALKFLPELYVDNDGFRPFALQVTKFRCVGFVLGIVMSHEMCDGYGVGRIMCALTELAGGKKLMKMPVWERERLVGKPQDDQLPFIPDYDTAASPYLPTDDWVTEKINIRADSIRKLKEATLKENDFSNESLTTFEVIGAYLWKSRVKALCLDPDGITVLSFAVEIRKVVDPPLSDGYYGNAYIDMYVPLTTREVEEYTISEIVKLMKEAKRKAHEEYNLREVLENIEKIIKLNLTFDGKDDGLFCLMDWRNIGLFGSMDFGWNEPVNLVPVIPTEIDRTTNIFMRPSRLEPDLVGGVQIVVTLPRIAMVKFMEEMKVLE